MKVGTVLSLSVNEQNEKNNQQYSCKIIDIQEHLYFIDYPKNDATGKTTIFFEGTQLSAKFVAKDQKVYTFQTKVVARRKMGDIPVLVLYFPGRQELSTIQRRDFVRVKTAVDVSVHCIDKEPVQTFSTSTVDISGGGTAIVTPYHITLHKGELLDIWIVLPFKSTNYHYVHTTGKVIRHFQKEKNLYYASIEFLEISNFDREKVIQYCFQKQLEDK
ncbi:flagellar brake protein [Salinibacillus xinjiangensis]|uniref:flagellar brake protein n=1 Tax=Salinibacillus xinjiangensis TaxID=1229268 RepID=UPI001891C37C|nr:flagellar brake domain-containing protein [Salinibacillus xinjiangensis]